MSTISVDLAYRSYADIGIAVVEGSQRALSVRFRRDRPEAQPEPRALATFLVALCQDEGSKTLLLDGPQGWKASSNGLEHSRRCERALNTPAKSGLPGNVKPRNYGRFVEFSIAVFDALADLGWARYTGEQSSVACVVFESFPFSAWRALKLLPIPAKRRCGEAVLTESASALRATRNISFSCAPSHDELQALVAGLAGPALEARDLSAFERFGVPPFVQEGSYREGFIVNPRPPTI